MDEPKKRGPGRPRKTPDLNPMDIIKQPQRSNLPNAIDLPDGDNNKYTSFALDIMKLPRFDLENPQQIEQRIIDYFQLCANNDMKPGVVSLALALGVHRMRLWEIATDHPKQLRLPQECKDYIKSAYNTLDALWEMYMQNGKVNPASGIFLGKNNFGYADTQEYVLTPNQHETQTDPKTIEAKYEELPE